MVGGSNPTSCMWISALPRLEQTSRISCCFAIETKEGMDWVTGKGELVTMNSLSTKRLVIKNLWSSCWFGFVVSSLLMQWICHVWFHHLKKGKEEQRLSKPVTYCTIVKLLIIFDHVFWYHGLQGLQFAIKFWKRAFELQCEN